MENDAWTHVKSKRKNGSAKPKKQNIVSKSNPLVVNVKDSDEDCGTAQDVITKCTKLSVTLSQSPLIKCLLAEFGRTNFTQFSTTVALGIGQFCSSQSSLLQLAMLLSIRSHQRTMSADGNSNDLCLSSSDAEMIHENISERKSNCVIFDPLLSSKEREVCSLLNCPVSSENRMGKHQTESGPTLFFMPHCPHRLYINLLWENWSQLDSVIILGNSFQSYSIRRSSEEDETDCMRILETLVTEIPLWDMYCSSQKGKKAEFPRELAFLENAFCDLRPTEAAIDEAAKYDVELFG